MTILQSILALLFASLFQIHSFLYLIVLIHLVRIAYTIDSSLIFRHR